jgi:hypothetical protein
LPALFVADLRDRRGIFLLRALELFVLRIATSEAARTLTEASGLYASWRDASIGSLLSPLGKLIVVVGRAIHDRNRFRIFHLVGQGAHFRGPIAPMLGVVDEVYGHGGPFHNPRTEKTRMGVNAFPDPPSGLRESYKFELVHSVALT